LVLTIPWWPSWANAIALSCNCLGITILDSWSKISPPLQRFSE
jgi:hypothetical protein